MDFLHEKVDGPGHVASAVPGAAQVVAKATAHAEDGEARLAVGERPADRTPPTTRVPSLLSKTARVCSYRLPCGLQRAVPEADWLKKT